MRLVKVVADMGNDSGGRWVEDLPTRLSRPGQVTHMKKLQLVTLNAIFDQECMKSPFGQTIKPDYSGAIKEMVKKIFQNSSSCVYDYNGQVDTFSANCG